MFARSIVERSIERVQAKLNFKLEYHSIQHVLQSITHLETISIYNERSGSFEGWTRPLDEDEKNFIQNERVLCVCDFEYWATRYAYIRYADETVELIRPNVAQRVIMDIWADNEEAGRSNILVELKARQLGVSTISELAVNHRAQFYPNVNAVVASCDPKKSELMAKMIELCFDQQPHWIKPPIVRRLVGQLIEFPQKNSGISIQHGNQNNGISRGTTPSCFHMSELSDFENPEELIDASLMRAIHSSPHIFGMFESTAKGRRNWWHETYEAAKEDWPAGRSRLRPIFLPWYVGRDLYPTETYLVDCPMPIRWRPLDTTINHAKKAAQFVANSPLLSKYLGSNWEMPREQMWFYECERDQARKKKHLNKFLAEMPGDDIEAFTSTNISAFDAEVISACRDNMVMPVACLGIRDLNGILPQNLQPTVHRIDSEREENETINIVSNWSGREPALKFQLVPLIMDGYPAVDFTNKLWIHEWPMDEEEYVAGVDTGDGVGQDRSVVFVMRKGTANRNDEQVAEFASAYVNSHDLSTICLCIGTLFSVMRNGMFRQPKFVIEVNRNGETVQFEMKKQGWSNFHIWVRYDAKRIEQAKSQKLGWVTNSWSRPMALDMLLKYINSGWFDINSPWYIGEMEDLERSWDAQDLKAVHGGHDDRIMASAIALLSAHVLETRGRSREIAAVRAESAQVTRGGQKTYARYVPQLGESSGSSGPVPMHQIVGKDASFDYAYEESDY